MRKIGGKYCGIFQTSGVLPPVLPVYESEYNAALAYMTSQGYALPSDTHKALDNALIKTIKDNIGWSRCKHLNIQATNGDSNTACVNYANLSINSTKVNNPTFVASQGFQTNGTNNSIDSNLPETAVGLTSNTFGLFLFSGNLFALGSTNLNTIEDLWLIWNATSQVISRHKGSSQYPSAVNPASMFRSINRFNSSKYSVFSDAEIQVSIASAGSMGSNTIKFGTTSAQFKATNLAFSFVFDYLSPSEQSILKTALETNIAGK